ncbi:MAG: hypothetical protein L3J57_04020 [Desulfuromusa sp.]|nr:hypothetical protein [Desulfuromusa sp.]
MREDTVKALLARRKNKKTIITATARELSAFIWAIAHAITPAQTEQ